jgi:hypothetical protein
MQLTPPERLLLAAIIHHSATNVIAIFLLSELFNLFLIDVDSREKISLELALANLSAPSLCRNGLDGEGIMAWLLYPMTSSIRCVVHMIYWH